MDIHELLNQFVDREQQLQTTQFLTPCVQRGKIRTRVAGLVYTFTTQDPQFEGWGIFHKRDRQTGSDGREFRHLLEWPRSRF